MKKNDKLFYALVFVTFLVLAYLLAQKVFQNDTFYTIKVGESIFKRGVDMKDHFSFVTGLSYTYPHWLFDSFIYLVYSIGGFRLIYLSTILLGFALLSTIFVCSIKMGNNKYISYLIILFFSMFLEGYFTARAQIFSYISLVMIIYSIVMFRNTSKKRYLIYLFLSSLVVANMHAAVWPFVLVLFLPFIVQDIISIIVKKFNLSFVNKSFNIDIEDGKFKMTMIAFLVCFITGFLTPNFLVPFTYYINTAKGISMEHINEHSPITIKGYAYVFYFMFFTLALFLNKKTKIKLWELFLIIGLFILAFTSIKNISLYIILSMFIYIRIFSSFDFKSIEPYLWNKFFISFLLVFFIVVVFVTHNNYVKKEYVDVESYPTDAVEFIKENIDYKNKNIFNQYDYGSYILFNDIPVFIDSRADLYLKEFNKDCNVFEDYFDVKNNYRLYFDKYDISYVILKNNTSLYSVIKNEKYEVIYKDDYFTIYDLGD